MSYKIKKYVDDLFENTPQNQKTYELKEEVLTNLNKIYDELIESGVDENSAYIKAISSIEKIEGFIEANVKSITPKEDKFDSALMRSIAVMLYILSPAPAILLGDEAGAIILLAMVALATGIMMYTSKSKIVKKVDEELYEEFEEWKDDTHKHRKFKKEISSIIWSITVLLYFIISFVYWNWHISWIIFLIGAVLQQIVYAYLDLKGESNNGQK